MPEWMIWMALIWVFFAVRGRHGCGWSGGHRRVHGGEASHRLGDGRSGHGSGDFALGSPARPVRLGGSAGSAVRNPSGGHRRAAHRGRTAARWRATSERTETPEERLRRQFVEGRLTIEEYEEKLWAEIGTG